MVRAIEFVLAAVGTVVMTAVYLAAVWWLDRFEKEPVWLLALTFLWGSLVATMVALFLQSFLAVGLMSMGAVGDQIMVSVVAPMTEEAFKGLAPLGVLLLFKREIDDPLDGLIYGAVAGLGFGFVENLFYLVGAVAEGVSPGLVFVMRNLFLGLMHGVFTGFTGLGVGFAKSCPRWKWLLVPGGYGLAVATHAVHNTLVSLGAEVGFLFTMAGYAFTILLMLGLVMGVWIYERHWIYSYLAGELREGHITQEQYRLAGSWARWFLGLKYLGRGLGEYMRKRRIRQLLAKLALRLRAYARTGDPAYMRDVEEIRVRLRELGEYR